MSFERELQTAKNAALEAGAHLREGFNLLQAGRIDAVKIKSYKQGDQSNFATNRDLGSEGIILKTIEDAFKGDAVLAEETKEHVTEHNGRLWIVDPLDGTRLYANGIPEYSISIGLWQDGVVKAGVIYAPSMGKDGHLFHAVRGEGAFLDGKPLVKLHPDHTLEQALIATGFHYLKNEDKLMEQATQWVVPILLNCADVVRYGSGAHDLVKVATGQFGGYLEEEGPKPWDLAAGLLIQDEMGCKHSIYDGKPIDIFHKNESGAYDVQFLTAKNERIHNQLLELVNK
ncbi:hypothetical protein CMO92_04665 [Candidatus Woesearchaeota archaeon]|nr:hypothetical protein [Candidatus Woesearchaeota archaeon]|tara:strand:+ start:278 stop:1135 length:858 start_codon:yes stop_codon:yes gene_type:complete